MKWGGNQFARRPRTRETVSRCHSPPRLDFRRDLLALYVDGDTAIAEWLAEFDDLEKGVRKRMREIAVMTFRGHLISSLREVWVGTL